MKYVNALVAAVVAAAALMVFANSASATVLTVTTANGTTDTVTKPAELTGTLVAGTKATLKSSFIGEVVCPETTIGLTVTNPGDSTTTVSGEIDFTIKGCNGHVTIIKGGTFELHTEGASANGNGTTTSTGTEFTVEVAGLHCIFTTSNTDVGKVAGAHGESHAIFTAASAAIPRTGGRSGAFCGSSATWSAQYTVTHLIWNNETFTNFTVD